MILEGPSTKCLKCQSLEESSKGAASEGYSACQSQETPLPVYIGVMLHVKTRKKELIDRLHTECMLLGC